MYITNIYPFSNNNIDDKQIEDKCDICNKNNKNVNDYHNYNYKILEYNELDNKSDSYIIKDLEVNTIRCHHVKNKFLSIFIIGIIVIIISVIIIFIIQLKWI